MENKSISDYKMDEMKTNLLIHSHTLIMKKEK